MKSKLTILFVLALAAVCGSQAFAAGIQFSVNIAPPPIAVFDQPPYPGDGDIWTLGYYQYCDYGYYWVPGQWVIPPARARCGRPAIGAWNAADTCGTKGIGDPPSAFTAA